MFRDRDDAALQLTEALQDRPMHDPLVLGIPRGGVAIGAVLARALRAELDVILARKLRAPNYPEIAIGAVGEDGAVYLNSEVTAPATSLEDYIARERRHQLDEIARSKRLFRSVRPPARIADRTVIVTDDGIATGSTMIAALHAIRSQQPRDLIVAVPVASAQRLLEIRPLCDDCICLQATPGLTTIGQYYRDFEPVAERRVIELLCEAVERGDRRQPALSC